MLWRKVFIERGVSGGWCNFKAPSWPGFAIEDVTARTIEASVEDWFECLSAYNEAVLGWSARRPGATTAWR